VFLAPLLRAIADSSTLPVRDPGWAKEVESVKVKETPPRDLALLAVAVILMLGGAATLVGGSIAPGIAIPLITIGIALVVIARGDVRHQHVKHVPRT
jgi:hypothetical protein